MSIYGVIKFQAPFEKMKEYDMGPEVRLYKSIILQAIIDASNTSNLPKAKKIELEAKYWIFGNGKYFQDVCYKANSHPEEVIKIAKQVIRLNQYNNSWIDYSINNAILKKNCLAYT